MLMLIIIFFFAIYKFYSSTKNINKKDFNRSNINKILKEKINNLPILENDTNNIIKYNDSFKNEINDKKKRSFWDLLKNK